VLREVGENEALQVASQMQTGTVVDLTQSLALDAARLSLPLADSIIYATAMRWGAMLWTQDEHFKKLPNVNYFLKQ
jgi:toxin FitB